MKYRGSAKILLFFAIILLQCQLPVAQIRYVTSIKPLRLILEEMVIGRALVIQIVPEGISPHHFEPLPSAMRQITSAQAVFFISKKMEPWIDHIAPGKTYAFMDMIPASSLLSAGEDKFGVTPAGADPHFWSDPITVKNLLPSLLAKLMEIDPAGQKEYQRNMALFSSKLDSFDLKARALMEKKNPGPVILSHPFFRYFLLRYHIPIAGVISPAGDFQTSPQHIAQMIRIARHKHVKVILTMSQHAMQSAWVISQNTGIPVMILYPLGYDPAQKNYFEFLEKNLQSLGNIKNE